MHDTQNTKWSESYFWGHRRRGRALELRSKQENPFMSGGGLHKYRVTSGWTKKGRFKGKRKIKKKQQDDTRFKRCNAERQKNSSLMKGGETNWIIRESLREHESGQCVGTGDKKRNIHVIGERQGPPKQETKDPEEELGEKGLIPRT